MRCLYVMACQGVVCSDKILIVQLLELDFTTVI